MAISTWHNIITGVREATYKSYIHKSIQQRKRKEIANAIDNYQDFCLNIEDDLKNGSYKVGNYRHFRLCDKKKERCISVLPFRDRCVLNDIKDAIEPLLLHYMTDDMFGGLPCCGVVATSKRNCVVLLMREAMNDYSLTYYLLGDISKFYDNVDKIISMRLIEQKVKDKRTLAIIRQHLMKLKKLAIGDPFSHLIANMNMSVVIRKVKHKYGKLIRLINFADDFIAFSKKVLEFLRKDMIIWAKQLRFRYKRMYIKPIDIYKSRQKQVIIFCGYKYGRGYVKLILRTKKRYIKARHRSRSMSSYNGLLKVADTKQLRTFIEKMDNKNITNKIRRPFAGKPMKIETLLGVRHTIVDFVKKSSKQREADSYYHIQAIAENIGLIVYSTSSQKICEYLNTKQKTDIPLRDMVIVRDWSGFYFKDTVYSDDEEEEIIRKQFNIPKT